MAKTTLKPGLNSLIEPSQFSLTEPCLIHQHPAFAIFSRLPFLKSLSHLLKVWPHSVQVHLPVSAQGGATDEAKSIDVTAKEAKAQFQKKKPLLFNQADRMSPVLTKWLNALVADLALPEMTYRRCMVYATPDGKGTAPHFDQNINFILQLTGMKTWYLAPNQNVTHPSQRHTMGLPIDPELASYCETPMPKKMPAEKIKVVLEPGSLLFVPQGYWHSTEAKGEALSLNFTFSQPNWVDLFTAALRSRLLLSPEWREVAIGVSAQSIESRKLSARKMDELLFELIQDLPNWNAADILGATEGREY